MRWTHVVALILCLAAPAAAQVNPSSLPANTVVGRTGIGSGPAQAIPFANLGSSLIPFLPAIPGTPGIAANVLNTQTTNYTIQTSDCGKTVQAGTGSTGFFTLTIPAVTGFNATCVVTLLNGDTTRGKAISSDPGCVPAYHILWPGQACFIGIVNGAWQPLAKPGRWQLTATTTLFADSTNGTDTAGATDCMATGASACHTITYAAKLFCDTMDPSGQQFNITPPSGATQTENVSLCNYQRSTVVVGTNGPQVLGNPASPATFVVTATSGVVFSAAHGHAPWTLNGISVGGGGSPPAQLIEADINTTYNLKNDILLTATGILLQSLYGGKVEITGGGVTLSASSAAAVVDTEFGGIFLVNSQTITCTTATSVSGAFAQALDGGLQNWSTAAFSGCGSVTGPRFNVKTGSVIETGGGGATFIPGSSGGSTNCTTSASSIGTCGYYN